MKPIEQVQEVDINEVSFEGRIESKLREKKEKILSSKNLAV
jgi:hypothetical protein